MNNDESSRNMHYSSSRKPIPPKNHVYSPSTNYNYNGNQSQHGNHGNFGNQNFNNQHPQRRKSNQFKRDGHGLNERLAKQNDVIIRLLKEIRDRLPAPAVVPVESTEPNQEHVEEPPTPLQEMPVETVVEQDTPPTITTPQVAVTADVPDDELDRQVNGNV
ncbi:MAG: hypothetical protein JXA18_06895 [Chitinispirillaceae bacterium]|nr:hypothetical protein [Chitinispirillaceae bacterium]